jgi:hypothetical protein
MSKKRKRRGGDEPPSVPGYVLQLLGLIGTGQIVVEPGRVYVTEVYHDDGCGIFAGGSCDCDPEVRLLPVG